MSGGYFMKKLRMMGIISIALLFGMVFIACKQEALSSDASLTGITVAGVKATLGTPSSDWQTVVPGDVYLTDAQLPLETAKVSASAADDGAIIYYTVTGIAGVTPNFVSDSNQSIIYEDTIWVEVFSANYDAVLFYAVKVHFIKPTVSRFALNQLGKAWVDDKGNISIADATIARSATLGTPGATVAEAVAGELIIGTSQVGIDLDVETYTDYPITDLKITKVTGSGVPSFSAKPATLSVAGGDHIYIEASTNDARESDGKAKLYYKIDVVAKTDTVLSSLNIASQSITDHTPGTTFAGTGVSKIIDVGARGNLSSVAVAAVGQVQDIKYGTSTSFSVEPSEWKDAGPLLSLEIGAYIGIRVTSELGTGYYKYQVIGGESGALIASATVSGQSASIGTPGSALDQALLDSAGEVTLTQASYLENENAIVVPGGSSAGATVEVNYFTIEFPYGPQYPTAVLGPAWTNGTDVFPYIPEVPAGNGPWGPTPPVPAVLAGIPEAGTNIAIRVTSENLQTVNYYAIKVTVNISQ
jgi:hypothetical protein